MIKKGLVKLTVWIAAGGGLGYSPVASGTAGSLIGVAIVWFAFSNISWSGQVLLALALTVLAWPICEVADRQYEKKDDGRIVADEFMTFPICMIGLWPAAAGDRWWIMLLCFLSCRFMDIVKPWPAHQLQRLPGGLGVLIDDVMASLYSLGANHLAVWLIYRYVL